MSGYTISLEPDGDTVLATCPDLSEVTTFGDDRAEALVRASSAVEEALAGRIAHSQDIPSPTEDIALTRPYVRLPLMTALKVELYRALRAAGMNRAELARRMGAHRNQVDRLFDLSHQSKLDQVEAAFAGLGLRIETAKAVEAA